MKTTLMKIKEKTKAWLSPKHPFYSMDKTDKRYYGAAILLQTQLSEAVSPVDHFELLRLFSFGLNLNRDDVIEVMRLSKDKEQVLDYIINMLFKRRDQITFLLDLSNVSYNGTSFGEKEWQAIDIYGELFRLPRNQVSMIKRFIQAAVVTNTQECMQIFSNMMQMGMECSLEGLRYYIPELKYTTVVDADSLIPGQKVELKGECEIHKPFIVPDNCELQIVDARLILYAPIIIKGGRLEISGSEVQCEPGDWDVCFQVENSDVVVKDSCFYCGNLCGVLSQNTGTLQFTDCDIYETNKKSAISFHGRKAEIGNCNFQKCYVKDNGAAIYLIAQDGWIHNGTFHNCYAQNGGAIATVSPVRIANCIFSLCHALDYGNSIYYKGLAQEWVQRCQYEDTMEERSQLVQVIENEKELRDITEINCSTHFKVSFHADDNTSVWIHNVMLFVESTMMLKGGLRMEHVSVVAGPGLRGDILDVSNGRAVTMRDCQFDGDRKNGILSATGTKITIRDCLFSNSKVGRAIYNSVDLECENSIFNNCESGAVYGTRALIKKSVFVNCRGKRGAALYLVNNKGLIKGCIFDRCIAETTGGAIITFGNYQVIDCVFNECQPDNMGT